MISGAVPSKTTSATRGFDESRGKGAWLLSILTCVGLRLPERLRAPSKFAEKALGELNDRMEPATSLILLLAMPYMMNSSDAVLLNGNI